MTQGDAHRILIIDDNAAIHEDFRKILAPPRGAADSAIGEMESMLFGETRTEATLPAFTLDSAFQGQEGLQRVEEAVREGRPYAMAFVDIRMPPGWDGIETIEHLWAVYPELEVAICTAYSDYSWEEMVARLGQNHRLLIVKKPFDAVEIRQAATALTAKWTLGCQLRDRLDNLQQLVHERTANLAESNTRLQDEVRQHAEARAAVDRLSRRLELILNSVGEGICGVDRAGAVTFANPAAAQMLGRRADSLLGQLLGRLVHPDRPALPAITRSCEAGEVCRTDDEHFVRQDGSAFIADCVSAPIRDGREIVGAVMTFRDVTARKEAEAQLALGKSLAEAATQAKSEFLANMSHEMRTPLNAILGFTDIALESTEAAVRRECLETVLRAGHNLLGIIDDILDLAKVESGTMELEQVAFPLRETLQEVLRTLEVRAGEKHLSLALEVAADVPDALVGDQSRLRQVLINLVGNAVKFTERGGVSVRVARAADGEPLALRFSVRDSGIGIPGDKLALIFQPFAQADGSMGRCYGGTGLGLSIATKFVEMMGGRIEVESQVGVGSAFHFVVRLRAAAAQERGGPPPARNVGDGKSNGGAGTPRHEPGRPERDNRARPNPAAA